MNMQKASLGLAVVALTIAAWMGRYEIIGSVGQVVRLDRWTGEIVTCERSSADNGSYEHKCGWKR